jgi:chorismate mutase
MHFNHWKIIIVVIVMIGQISVAYAQNAAEQLQPLIETTAHRLMIGEQVALAKWDSGKGVEDAPREAKVIRDAVKDGVARGLDEASVSKFFNAQIEANKFVQYELLADWHRTGKPPEHAPVDLMKNIRPELDKVQEALITELVDTVDVRKSKTCGADIAKAVGNYVSTHAQSIGPITAAATLDRALAGACIP